MMGNPSLSGVAENTTDADAEAHNCPGQERSAISAGMGAGAAAG